MTVSLGLVILGCEGTGASNRFQYYGFGLEDVPALWASLPCSRIELRRDGIGFGFFPDMRGFYSVILSRAEGDADEGTCVASGTLPTGVEGHFAGSVPLADYSKLCWLLEDVGLEGFDAYYPGPPTSHGTGVVLRVFREHEEAPIRVGAWGGDGPAGLWAIHRCIDSIVTSIDWDRVDAPDPRLAEIR